MTGKSKIEWTEVTWNPVTGCTKVSPGCANCYAESFARRLKGAGSPNYRRGFKVSLHKHLLKVPLRWRKPRLVFVNSMSDIFHKDVPDDFILKMFDVMTQASQHTFQVLTKRSERLAEFGQQLTWPENVWAGVTVEMAAYKHRIADLKSTDAAVKFISFEPLLGAMGRIALKGIDWVIAGGESGPRARPVKKEWVVAIRDQCVARGIPFFFKQWGGRNKKKAGRHLDGRTWDQMPLREEAHR